ncbi:hypothetical protein T12_15184 [Trichinella patagoniensis]|uniref:Uncharacterized protein n=1 Tax=Trichinella patagoniensis TaxID=990121 RepID=A0A0V0YP90_9BILA|nr:hypothetical protein T12_15184 [Trichinella patagoniensis]
MTLRKSSAPLLHDSCSLVAQSSVVLGLCTGFRYHLLGIDG